MFLVDNISLYNDESLALDMTSDADWKRRGLYMGPAVSLFETEGKVVTDIYLNSSITSMRLFKQSLRAF
jgi:hypothetical protein